MKMQRYPTTAGMHSAHAPHWGGYWFLAFQSQAAFSSLAQWGQAPSPGPRSLIVVPGGGRGGPAGGERIRPSEPALAADPRPCGAAAGAVPGALAACNAAGG